MRVLSNKVCVWCTRHPSQQHTLCIQGAQALLVSNTLCPDLSTHTLHQVDSLICVDEIANLVHTRIAMDNAATIRLPPTSKDAHLRAAELITKHGPWLWTT